MGRTPEGPVGEARGRGRRLSRLGLSGDRSTPVSVGGTEVKGLTGPGVHSSPPTLRPRTPPPTRLGHPHPSTPRLPPKSSPQETPHRPPPVLKTGRSTIQGRDTGVLRDPRSSTGSRVLNEDGSTQRYSRWTWSTHLPTGFLFTPLFRPLVVPLTPPHLRCLPRSSHRPPPTFRETEIGSTNRDGRNPTSGVRRRKGTSKWSSSSSSSAPHSDVGGRTGPGRGRGVSVGADYSSSVGPVHCHSSHPGRPLSRTTCDP